MPSGTAATTDPQLSAAIEAVREAATKLPKGAPKLLDDPNYADLVNLGLAGFVLLCILLITKYARGFVSNIAVLLGIVIGGVVAFALGKMSFDKVAKAQWLDVVTPFSFGMPTFDVVMILTMTLVMIVVMIESTGMFLALSDITGKPIGQQELSAGLRTDGLGTLDLGAPSGLRIARVDADRLGHVRKSVCFEPLRKPLVDRRDHARAFVDQRGHQLHQ